MHIITYIIETIFPDACGICGKICKNHICSKCMYKLNQIKQVKKHIYLKRNFTTHMYIFKYEDLIRKNIIQYKFKEQTYKYKAFSKFIIKEKNICRFLKKYDIIIPVPISKKRNNQRGYNQSSLIARELGKNLKNVQIKEDILYKVKDTLPQSSLKLEQRMYNLKDAYKVQKSEIIKNKKILLFDDIFTTGSTVDECAKVLKSAGAEEVGVLTFAKD